jgi:hypothetical protein
MAKRTTHLHSAPAVDRQPYAPALHSACWRSDMMPRYRKKPGEIEAVRWNGANRDEVRVLSSELPPELLGRLLFNPDGTVMVPTRDGDQIASRWDWLIRDIDGTVFPITHECFAETYEPVTVTVRLVNV